jgi:hypothetical protein
LLVGWLVGLQNKICCQTPKHIPACRSGFLHILSSWINIKLHTSLPGSALKVCVVVVMGGLEISDRLWLRFSLALAKPNNSSTMHQHTFHLITSLDWKS